MIDTWNPAKLNEKISGRDSWNPAILNEAVTDRDSWNPAILNESAGETPVVFKATITASFPEGATCTATDGTTTLTADDNPMVFNIPNEGTWAVACVANGVTFSEDVVITTDGQAEAVDLTPVGSTITPTDSVGVLIACAGIGDSTYTTISDVIADSDLLEEITTNDNTIAYLVRSTTFAAIMVANEDTMAAIGASNGCSDALLSDSTWLNAICNSQYFESVLNVKVPAMTDNTHPSGEVSASSSGNVNCAPYKAFDGTNKDDVNSTCWESAIQSSDTNFPYIQYNFGRNVRIYKAVVDNHARYQTTSTFLRDLSFKVQGLLAAQSTPIDISSVVTAYKDSDNYTRAVNLSGNEYPIIRIQATSNNATYKGYYVAIYRIQFYGRQDV